MPYKFEYFPIRGRGEVFKILCAAAGKEIEAVEVHFPEWAAKKATTPFGSMPVLSADGGVVIGQSLAALRYLANEFGLAGKTAAEKARADELVDFSRDFFSGDYFLINQAFTTNHGTEELKEAIRQLMNGRPLPESQPDGLKKAYANYIQSTIKPKLPTLQRCLEENKAKSGWFVGSELTWADVVIGEHLQFAAEVFDPHVLDNFPALKAFHDKFVALPGVAERIATRPKRPF